MATSAHLYYFFVFFLGGGPIFAHNIYVCMEIEMPIMQLKKKCRVFLFFNLICGRRHE